MITIQYNDHYDDSNNNITCSQPFPVPRGLTHILDVYDYYFMVVFNVFTFVITIIGPFRVGGGVSTLPATKAGFDNSGCPGQPDILSDNLTSPECQH